jgi:hypothetical protein
MAEDNIYVDPKTGVRYRLGGNDGEPMVRLDPTFTGQTVQLPNIDLTEVGAKIDAWVEDAIDSVADKFKPEVK